MDLNEQTSLFSGRTQIRKVHNDKKGGLWPLVTVIGVGIGIYGIMCNIITLVDWDDIRSEYQGSDYNEPLAFTRVVFIHLCAMFLCVLVVAAELDIVLIVSHFDFLNNWLARGLFYFFVGVMTYNNDSAGKYSLHTVNQIGTLMLMSFGLFYIVTGVLLDIAPTMLTSLVDLQGLPEKSNHDL